MTKLTQRTKGANSNSVALQDLVLETGWISVNQDAYSTDPDSTPLDRVYDVRGLKNFPVRIKNTGGTNGLTYKIEKAVKDYTLLSSLVDADFDQDIKADTNVAFGASNVTDIIDVSPEATSIRIKIKRQTSGQDTTLAGSVGAN